MIPPPLQAGTATHKNLRIPCNLWQTHHVTTNLQQAYHENGCVNITTNCGNTTAVMETFGPRRVMAEERVSGDDCIQLKDERWSLKRRWKYYCQERLCMCLTFVLLLLLLFYFFLDCLACFCYFFLPCIPLVQPKDSLCTSQLKYGYCTQNNIYAFRMFFLVEKCSYWHRLFSFTSDGWQRDSAGSLWNCTLSDMLLKDTQPVQLFR